MNESTVEREQTEDDMITDKVSDEALEAAASGTTGEITLHPHYPPYLLPILLTRWLRSSLR